MIESINRRYLIFGIIILLFLIPFLGNEYTAIYVVNIITLFTYYLTINNRINKPDRYFTRERLGYIILFYSQFHQIFLIFYHFEIIYLFHLFLTLLLISVIILPKEYKIPLGTSLDNLIMKNNSHDHVALIPTIIKNRK